MANQAWINLFSDTSVKHIMSSRSDHLPLVLQTGKLDQNDYRPAVMKYECMWERDESLTEQINEAWDSAGHFHNLADIKTKLRRTMNSLEQRDLWKSG